MTDIYIQFTEDGQHIRYWSREPFEGGVGYGVQSEIDKRLAFLISVEVECNGHFNGDLTHEEALDNIRDAIKSMYGDPLDTTTKP